MYQYISEPKVKVSHTKKNEYVFPTSTLTTLSLGRMGFEDVVRQRKLPLTPMTLLGATTIVDLHPLLVMSNSPELSFE